MTFEQNPPFSPAEAAPYVPQPSGTVTQRAGLGITALAIAVPVFVLSLIASVLVGIAAGQIAPIGGGSFSDGFADGYAAGAAPENMGFSLAAFAHVALGTLLGGAALVIGIIAIALKRGRGQGIAAVIVAGTAPIISFIVYTVVAGVVATTRVL